MVSRNNLRTGTLCVLLLGISWRLTASELGRNRDDPPARPVPSRAMSAQAVSGRRLGLAAPPHVRLGGVGDVLPGVVIGARSDEPCDLDELICGQAPGACGSTTWYFYSDLEFCYPDPTTCRRVRCENFPPPGTEPLDPNDPNDWIAKIIWYGVYVDESSNGCQKPHDFRIRFYDVDPDTGGPWIPNPNDPNDPNNYTYQEFVTATAEEVGIPPPCWEPYVIRWRFTALLSTPVRMASGWFSICGYGTPHCYFLWEGSNQGDNRIYQWYEEGAPTPQCVTDKCDLSYCLHASKTGACCNDCTGLCENDVPQLTCQTLGGRFAQNQPCSVFGSDPDLPACGEAPGACCFDNGNCQIETCAQCLAAQGQWLGAGVPCDQCCVIVDEPSTPFGTLCLDSVPEGEPLCGPGYIDTYNGGCDSTPPVFQPITPDVPIHGESGTPEPCVRDTDWFSYDTGQGNVYLAFTVEAEFDVAVFIVYPGACHCAGDCNCDGTVDFGDINPFVLVLSDPTAYGQAFPDCDVMNSDINTDGTVDFGDINPFVAILAAGGGPCPPAYSIAAAAEGPECTAVTAATAQCVPGGEYWFVVVPNMPSGVPCGADYCATLATPVPCTP